MTTIKINSKAVAPCLFVLSMLSACEKTDVPVKSLNPLSTSATAPIRSSISIDDVSPSSGKIGQEITIHGSGLSDKNDQFDTTALFIQGVRIHPKSFSPEKIVFVVPPSAPSGFISIKVADDSLKSQFAFNTY